MSESRGKRPEDHEEWCAFWVSDGVEHCDCPPVDDLVYGPLDMGPSPSGP